MDQSAARKKNTTPPEPAASPKLQAPKVVVQDQGLPDLPFFLLTVLLVIIGLVVLFSASYPRAYAETDGANGAFYFVRQLFFALPGLVILWFVSRVNYEWLRPFANWIMLGSVALLILVLLIGSEGGGGRRWLYLGFFSFQPSEVVKAAIVIYFAARIVKLGDKMQTFRYGFLHYVLILGVVAVLMLLEPHLSGTIIILGTGVAMMFLGGTRLRYFALVLILGGGAVLLIQLLVPGGVSGFLMSYAQDRIMAWRDPEAYASDEGYQIVQSLYAIGSGGLMGLGLGKSRQKYLYLPEEHNDYIFSIVCEELGFVGAVLVLVLFAMLIIRGYWIALHAKSRFGSLLAAGFTTLLAIQVFLNIGVVTNFLPATGITLPFFSYGGTALLLNLAEMGVILGVSRQKKSVLE